MYRKILWTTYYRIECFNGIMDGFFAVYVLRFNARVGKCRARVESDFSWHFVVHHRAKKAYQRNNAPCSPPAGHSFSTDKTLYITFVQGISTMQTTCCGLSATISCIHSFSSTCTIVATLFFRLLAPLSICNLFPRGVKEAMAIRVVFRNLSGLAICWRFDVSNFHYGKFDWKLLKYF